jgi:DNA-binding transcriptional regulator PaaX
MNTEKKIQESTEQVLTIPIISCNYWFMKKLGYMQREKIRVHYRLKEPTLKITDEMLKKIYETEIAKPKWERLLESRFYNYS